MVLNFNKNYYAILGIKFESTKPEIKKSYYTLSFIHHPDKGGDELLFSEIKEAYNILTDEETKKEYDKKSRYGKDYNELVELYLVNIDIDYQSSKNKLEDLKKNEILDIILDIDEKNFNGEVEYERLVTCKSCRGSGKDTQSKIVIKDDEGNVKGIFDSEDGCDYCEGTGKDWKGNDCGFCFGYGKVGVQECQSCKGERRILGKQKLTKIKLSNEEKTIVPHMGHFSKNEPGKVGNLILIKKSYA